MSAFIHRPTQVARRPSDYGEPAHGPRLTPQAGHEITARDSRRREAFLRDALRDSFEASQEDADWLRHLTI